MNILFLLTQSLDSPSGLGRYRPLALELSRRGHQVSILALHPNYASLGAKREKINGVCIEYVGQMQVRKRGNVKSYFPAPLLFLHMLIATWRLGVAAFKARAEIICVGKPHPMNGIAGWLASRLHRVPLWVDCDDYEAASGRFTSHWQRSIVAWFEKRLPPRADLVTCNTRFMAEKLSAWGVLPEKLFYLPNGLDPERFSRVTQPELDQLREELALSDNPIVLYLGSLSLPSHPVNLLLEAFALARARVPQAVLLIVGGGEDLPRLKELTQKLGIKDQVRFCGRVNPNRAAAYYQLATVSVEPVHDDEAARGRCPLKLFESWAMGAPFVTADVGDRRSILGEPPAGILTTPGDASSLAEAIVTLLTDRSLAAELAQRGKERAVGYAWEVLARRLEPRLASIACQDIHTGTGL